MLQPQPTQRDTLFLSAPIWEGQTCRGVSLGPGLIKAFSPSGLEWRASALASPHSGKMGYSDKLRSLRDDVRHHLINGERAIAIGGDHSLAVGSISGALSAYPDLGVIWIDAHGDLNTPRTSPSGNLHGMPLGFLLGLCSAEERLAHFAWLRERLLPSRLCLIGVRDLDPAETRTLEQLGILFYTAQEVHDYGAQVVAQNALRYLKMQGARGVHLSVDVDALDPTEFALTGTRVSGGLTFEQLSTLTDEIEPHVRSADLVEFNPVFAQNHFELLDGSRKLSQWCERMAGRVGEPWACAN